MAIIDKLLSRNNQQKQVAHNRNILKKISTLDDAGLEALATGDEDITTRCEAVMRLGNSTTLATLAFDESNPALARSGRQRIADLLDSEALSLDQFKQINELDQRLAIAALLVKEHLQNEILADIDDQQDLLQIAKDNTSARIRHWAAEKLDDNDAQAELLKHSRGKDRTVYKLIKAKQEALLAQQKQQQSQREKISELAESIERHSKSPFDHLYQAKRDHLLQQWQQSQDPRNTPIDAEKTQIETSFAACQVVIDAARDPVEIKQQDVAEPEAVPVANDVDKIRHQRQELLDGIKKVLLTLVEDSAAVDRAHTELNCAHIDQRWQELQQQVAASKEEHDLYRRMQQFISQELDQTDRHGSIKNQFNTLFKETAETEGDPLFVAEKSVAEKSVSEQAIPEEAIPKQAITVFKRRLQSAVELAGGSSIAIQELQQAFQKISQQWQVKRKQEFEQQQITLRQISGLIRKSHGALQIGKTAQAQGIKMTLEEKVQRLASVPKHIQKQLQELDQELSKVKDWKEYAVLPKKQALVEQMQALIGIEDNPEAMATKIKRLQDEWKALSKGGFADDGGLWESFRTAGDEAFKPCADYFSEQAKVRRENLNKRETLVQQLQDYAAQQDWENADWRQVAKLVQVAFNEWRGYQPVDRAANKRVQKSFDSIIKTIRGKLDQDYHQNKESKKALLEQAQKLVEAEDNRKAIEDVKLLQSRWQTIGSASHKADQSLWKQFRKHCDAVFDKRKKLSAEFKAEINDNKAKVLSLCAELDQLGEQKLADLLAACDRVTEIKSAYHDIGNLPKAQARDLQQRFKQAVDVFERKVIAEQTKAKAGAWDSMLRVYEQVRQYQLTILTGADGADQKVAAEALLSEGQQLPKGSLPILQSLFEEKGFAETGLAEKNLDESSNGQEDNNRRRLLCIRAEILAGLESPKEDHGLRMEYQVQQLAKGFGQNNRSQFKNGREALQALLLEWIALVPSATEDYQSLLARINLCRNKLGV